MLWSMESQRVRHDWVTELNPWLDILDIVNFTLLHTGYFYIPINTTEPCFRMQWSYLETVWFFWGLFLWFVLSSTLLNTEYNSGWLSRVLCHCLSLVLCPVNCRHAGVPRLSAPPPRLRESTSLSTSLSPSLSYSGETLTYTAGSWSCCRTHFVTFHRPLSLTASGQCLESLFHAFCLGFVVVISG